MFIFRVATYNFLDKTYQNGGENTKINDTLSNYHNIHKMKIKKSNNPHSEAFQNISKFGMKIYVPSGNPAIPTCMYPMEGEVPVLVT
jgi:hypothetical protein